MIDLHPESLDLKTLYPGAIFLLDKGGVVADIVASNQWPSFLKRPFLQESFLSIFDPSMEQDLMGRLSHVFQTGSPFSYKWKVVGEQPYYGMVTFQRISDFVVMATVQDITDMELEYKNARIQQKMNLYEEKIWQWNQILNIILEHTPFFIFVKDVQNDFRYLYNNVGYEALQKVSIDYCGKNDYEFLPMEEAEAFHREDIAVIHDNYPHRFVHKELVGGKEIYTETLKIYIDEPNRAPLLIGIVRDITEEETKKQELKSKFDQTKQSESIKTNFIANISKEIRSPLNVIVGFSELLANSEEQETRNYYKKIIEENSKRLTLIVDELLDLTRIKEGNMELNYASVSPYALCEDLYHAYSGIKHKQTTLTFDPSPNDLLIESDSVRLYQVMSYILNSACRVTFDGSINYGYYVKENMVYFYVKDSSMKMNDSDVDYLFSLEEQHSNSVNASIILELTLSKLIVESMGGEIHTLDLKKQGAEMLIRIPLKGKA